MTTKLLIVYRPIITQGKSQDLQNWTLSNLVLSAATLPHVDIKLLSYDEFDADDEQCGAIANRYDAVMFRSLKYRADKAGALAAAFTAAGKLVFDKRIADGGLEPISKEMMYNKMIELGVMTPHTERVNNINEIEFADEQFVLKPIRGGRRGRGVYLIDSQEKLDAAINDINTNEANANLSGWVKQQYIPNNGDCRIITIGGHVVAMSKRKPKDLTRLNLDRSLGKSERLDVVPNLFMASGVVKYVNEMGLFFASADVCLSEVDGKVYVIEVNEAPSVKTISKRCGVNITSILLDLIHEEVEINGRKNNANNQ